VPPFCLGYALRRGLKRPTNVFGLAKGGESRNGRSNFNNPRFSRQNPVAPALAGAYSAFRFRPTDVMGPRLCWDDGIWVRAPRLNELFNALRPTLLTAGKPRHQYRCPLGLTFDTR
jgi:hypothetical protein